MCTNPFSASYLGCTVIFNQLMQLFIWVHCFVLQRNIFVGITNSKFISTCDAFSQITLEFSIEKLMTSFRWWWWWWDIMNTQMNTLNTKWTDCTLVTALTYCTNSNKIYDCLFNFICWAQWSPMERWKKWKLTTMTDYFVTTTNVHFQFDFPHTKKHSL